MTSRPDDVGNSDGVPPALPPRPPLSNKSSTENWITTADGLIIPPPPSRRPSGSSGRTTSSISSSSSSHTTVRPGSTRVPTAMTGSDRSQTKKKPARSSSSKRLSALGSASNKFRRSLFGSRNTDARQDSHVVNMNDSRCESMFMEPPPLPPRRGKRDLSQYTDDARHAAVLPEKSLPRMPSVATLVSTTSLNGASGDDSIGGMGDGSVDYSNEKSGIRKRFASLPLIRRCDEWLARKHPRVYPYRHALYVTVVLFSIGFLVIIICLAAGVGKSDHRFGDVGEPGLDLSGSGDGTYYDPSIGAGSCGAVHQGDEFVAALNAPQYGSYANPNASPVCGKCIKVTGPKGTVKVKIVDKCPVCKNGDVDMSPAAFDMIADEVQGRVPITWEGC